MRSIRWLTLALIFFVLGVVGCGEKPSPELFSTGYVRQKEVQVYSGIVGTVTRVCCDRGSQIEKGQILIETDDTQLRLILNAASARRNRIAAQIRKSRAESDSVALVTDPVELNRDRALLDMAQIGIEEAQDAVDRKVEMARKGSVPVDALPGVSDDIEGVQSYLDDTLAATQAAEQDLNDAEESSDEALKVLESELEESSVAEKLAENRLKQAKIKAPASGEISERHVEVGEVIFPERALFTICVPEEKWIDAYVTESGLAKIKKGSQVDITCLEAFPDRHFTGSIIWISSKAEFSPKSLQSGSQDSNLVFPIKISLPSNTPLRAGMAVKISLKEDKRVRSNQSRYSDPKIWKLYSCEGYFLCGTGGNHLWLSGT